MIVEQIILLLIHHHYRVSESEGAVLDFRDLMAVNMVGDNLRAFLNDWEMTLSGMKKAPSEEILRRGFGYTDGDLAAVGLCQQPFAVDGW